MTNLIKRKKAERRFQLYGIFAVSLSLLFVLTLIVNIFSSGVGGFYKTSFLMEIHFDQKLLKLEDNPSSCLLYTYPSPRDMRRSRMPSSA